MESKGIRLRRTVKVRPYQSPYYNWQSKMGFASKTPPRLPEAQVATLASANRFLANELVGLVKEIEEDSDALGALAWLRNEYERKLRKVPDTYHMPKAQPPFKKDIKYIYSTENGGQWTASWPGDDKVGPISVGPLITGKDGCEAEIRRIYRSKLSEHVQ